MAATFAYVTHPTPRIPRVDAVKRIGRDWAGFDLPWSTDADGSESFGPVVNADGSPTAATLAFFGRTPDRDTDPADAPATVAALRALRIIR